MYLSFRKISAETCVQGIGIRILDRSYAYISKEFLAQQRRKHLQLLHVV